jgi:hypothetical protein
VGRVFAGNGQRLRACLHFSACKARPPKTYICGDLARFKAALHMRGSEE